MRVQYSTVKYSRVPLTFFLSSVLRSADEFTFQIIYHCGNRKRHLPLKTRQGGPDILEPKKNAIQLISLLYKTPIL